MLIIEDVTVNMKGKTTKIADRKVDHPARLCNL